MSDGLGGDAETGATIYSTLLAELKKTVVIKPTG